MIDLRRYLPGVEIRLDKPGVYVFPHSSAVGKTYLCTVLKDLSTRERVDSLTYSSIATIDIDKFFNSEAKDLLMLDRYDMYAGQFLDEITRFSKTGIILIACESSYHFPMNVKPCRIRLYDNRIVVL